MPKITRNVPLSEQPVYTIAPIPAHQQAIPSTAQQQALLPPILQQPIYTQHVPVFPARSQHQQHSSNISYGLSKPMIPPLGQQPASSVAEITTGTSFEISPENNLLPDYSHGIRATTQPALVPNRSSHYLMNQQQSMAWPIYGINMFPPRTSFPGQFRQFTEQQYAPFMTGIADEYVNMRTGNRLPPNDPPQPGVPNSHGPAIGMHSTAQQSIPAQNASTHYPLLQHPTMAYFPPLNSMWNSDGVITPQQLAARHVVSKELPKFSGDPLEWPMFLSSFESTTAMCGIQPDENLARLQKSLVRSAREKVQSILTLPSAIPEIINTLRDECGRPEQLVNCLLSKIRCAPVPNVSKLETLVTFGREVRNLVTYIEAANLHAHLSNPMLLMELVGKLPPSLRLDWGLHSQRIPEVTLKAFSDYASSIKTAACHVSLPIDSGRDDGSTRRSSKKEKGGFLNAHSIGDERRSELEESFVATELNRNKGPKPCHACQRIDHRIRNCDTFVKLTPAERLKLVEEHNLCKCCLTGHGKWPCRTKHPCGINDCKELHHKLLHASKAISSEAREPGLAAVISAHCTNKTTSLFKIIPVVLRNKGKSVTTFAFLDDGSNLTLLENAIASKLGLDGTEALLCLQWTSNVTRNEYSSKKVQLTIRSADNKSEYVLQDVRTVDNLGLPKQNLDYKKISQRFAFLRGLPIQSYADAVPGILIGVDHARLMLPLSKRDRRDTEPIAIKTCLGWTVFGGRCESDGPERLMVHACSCSADRELNDLVKDYFAMEDIGIHGLTVPETAEDQRARKILQQTTKRTESGKFETGLLWKTDKIEFPNSFPMAERRLKCLERRLRVDPELQHAFSDQIVEYLERGYAHKATSEELQGTDPRKVWYLPLGVVRNPRKPTKIRIVWDAAAAVKGVSLNSMLLKGPDLLKPLLSVLCRFRQKQYAITADIRQMFHQIIVQKEDRQSQRFLWRTDPESPPEVYVMDVATFGATCSPCSAQYIKNTNALDYSERYPDAALAIVENTYVDDYLDSRDTIEEALNLAMDVRLIHSKAGFEIRNWQSNSEQILARVGEKAPHATKSFLAEKTAIAERILGMVWIPNEDVFAFTAQFRPDLQPLLSGAIIPTKRQVLQVVMSLFDPLGIVSTFTVHGKILIQDVWRSGVGWDDSIINEDFSNWQRWVKRTSELDCCIFPNY
ncbi:uncharacterized protein LOC131696330 [Topomyia yanbarensis]|uniref:uncharacterized protein LOC131696330 n=1 Tax=Topomyia yanbarensis TaxID=2498891 RepID=UPI00273AA21C|nr:uncharacterized protein LOC131696330 [Topomyia yanbarensis]